MPPAAGAGRQQGDDPGLFRLRSAWDLDCPREPVWDTLADFHSWPLWWPGLDGVIETIQGEPGGIGQRATSIWHGPVGSTLRVEIEAVDRLYPESLRGVASGDVAGEGTWRLSPAEGWTTVEFAWDLRAGRRWMELLAPVARPLLAASHEQVMSRGAEGLAARLECPVRGFSARVG